MVRRIVARRAVARGIVLACLLASPALALDDGDLALTVTAEVPGGATPYPREMVLLRIRGTYRAQIALEDLRQPSLPHFGWTQLGRDRWFRTTIQGQEARGFERTVAVFPQGAGRFVVDPFVHRLTLVDGGERRLIEVRSNPLPLDVAAWQGLGGPDAPEPWWLPAEGLTVTDLWEPEPETLRLGEPARRTVTLEARGLTADALPPRPTLRTRGILTFAGPVERQTRITPAGPVARVTYRWDVRPGVPEPITLAAISIPWFDTRARVMREAEIPARIVGARAAAPAEEAPPPPASPWRALVVGLAAFGFGLGAWGLSRREAPPLRALIRAARRRDARGFHAALSQAARRDPGRAAAWRADPGTGPRLAALDAALFGTSQTPVPDLAGLARDLRTIRVDAARPDGLAPLDGPRPAPR
ncbi:Oxygen tolerance [Methylobacterium sp. 174MFSha1.1]|uniref:BatD family protein n=1 Tax=Methylobacterium sp. 174MFSha1.1 TaxID=1502749 RepID=UPI0008F00D30|nr:BatD family protein [Methylobacterium sp. 174MFSha1.1]SFU99135.1 Oxygen tolerance [Methylobacterium sp. 174MFSha1.1]